MCVCRGGGGGGGGGGVRERDRKNERKGEKGRGREWIILEKERDDFRMGRLGASPPLSYCFLVCARGRVGVERERDRGGLF